MQTKGALARELAHQARDRMGDFIAALDELVDLMDRPKGTELVLFHWSTEQGSCYECGLPAAFYLPDAYGRPREANSVNKRCAVCAANAAVDGERVLRIAPLDD